MKTGPEKEKMASKVRRSCDLLDMTCTTEVHTKCGMRRDRLYIRRDVKFLENEFDIEEKPETQKRTATELPDISDQEEQVTDSQKSTPRDDADKNVQEVP